MPTNDGIKLSRRTFLKAAGVAAAGAAAWKATGRPKVPGAAALAEETQSLEDQWIPTTCRGCGPGGTKCALLAHRVNGVVVRVKGNPDFPLNHGKNCGRSNAMVGQLYNPYRVKYPVKRTNPEKGPGVDPGWMEISWEEAFNTVAEKLKQVHQEDPRKFMIVPGHLKFSGVSSHFAKFFGTPNVVFAGTSTFCGGGSSPVSTWVLGGGHAYPDMPRCKYVLNFGAQSIQGSMGTPAGVYNYILGKDAGVHVVNVSPMITASTAKADEWVPMRPGTVIPFCMSMVHVLINELKVYDADSLTKRTNAPYLIGPDGKYVRDNSSTAEDPVRGGLLGKALVWDTLTNSARPFDDPAAVPALEGTYTVNGVTARTAFEVLKEHARGYQPEDTEAITTIPAATVRRLAKEWAENAMIGSTITMDGVTLPYRPVAAIAESGAKGHIDNYHIVQAALLLCQLVGAGGVPGSMNSVDNINMAANPADGVNLSALTYKPIVQPSPLISQGTLYPTGWAGGLAYKVLAEPERYQLPYEPEVLGFHGGNGQRLGADPEAFDKAFMRFPFVFGISLMFDEPTELADIVFPEASWLELHDANAAYTNYNGYGEFSNGATGTTISQPVVEPVYDTKEGNDVWLELARRIGIAEGEGGFYAFLSQQLKLEDQYALPLAGDLAWADVVNAILRSKHGDEHNLEWFKEHGFLLNKPLPVSNRYPVAKFPDVRMPIYFEEYVCWKEQLAAEIKEKQINYKPSNDFVLQSYQPLPVWREHPEHTAPAEYTLYAINFHTMELYFGDIENPWTAEWSYLFNPYAMRVLVNPAVAKELGLKDGDQVELESFAGGKTTGAVKVTGVVTPETVAIGGAWGAKSMHVHPWARRGAHFNPLLKIEERFFDPIGGRMELTTKVRLTKV